jgi:hypothetical protein
LSAYLGLGTVIWAVVVILSTLDPNLYGANMALTSFYDGVGIHTMVAEADPPRSTCVEQIRERLTELWLYLAAKLINYGKEHREGHRTSTARVESIVDQLVDCRMEKKQHMRWTRRGAQMLLHARLTPRFLPVSNMDARAKAE